MTKQTLNTVAGIFGRCFVLCVGLQVVSVVMYLLLHDRAIPWHASMFHLSHQQVDLAVYYFFMLLKTAGLTLFLIPWAALKWTARKL